MLDQIADRRRNYLRATILAGVVLPHEFASTYGDGIAARFGFPRGDETEPSARLTVLDLDTRGGFTAR